MVTRHNIKRFARKLDDGAGRVWSTKEERMSCTDDNIQDVTQRFSGFDSAPATPPMTWWQRKRQGWTQAHEAKQKEKTDAEDQEMPKKSTKEKLDEIFDARGDTDSDSQNGEEDNDDSPDVYADDAVDDDKGDQDLRQLRRSGSKKAPSSKQKEYKQEKEYRQGRGQGKRFKYIEENIKKKEQELATLMKEEKEERAEIRRQKKELKVQQKASRGAEQSSRPGTRHPIVTGFLMAFGFVLFFALIAGIAYAVTIVTGRPFNEFIRLVIKV